VVAGATVAAHRRHRGRPDLEPDRGGRAPARRVNPATVSKAYQRLTEAGLLEVRRGDGTYVAARPPVLSRSERARTLREDARRYAAAALPLGATCDEAVEELEAAWADLARHGRGGDR
jgi:DNA-binding transcriptional regulator YhcF (GntR family)